MINSHIHLDLYSNKLPFKDTTGVIIPSTGKDNWGSIVSHCKSEKYRHFSMGAPSKVYNEQVDEGVSSFDVLIAEEKPIEARDCSLDESK